MEKRKNNFGKWFHCVQITFQRTNQDTAWELGREEYVVYETTEQELTLFFLWYTIQIDRHLLHIWAAAGSVLDFLHSLLFWFKFLYMSLLGLSTNSICSFGYCKIYGPIIFGNLYICTIISRYTIDLIVCVALGADMFDCVYPTRTAVSSEKFYSEKQPQLTHALKVFGCLATNVMRCKHNSNTCAPTL